MRKRAWMMELFPAPVLPTIPIFYPFLAEKEIPLRTKGRPYLYLALKSLKDNVALSGHS